jgi:hypothetical protein
MLTRGEIYTAELIQRNRREMQHYYAEKLRPATESRQPEWPLTMASFQNSPVVLEDYVGRHRVLSVQPGEDAVNPKGL